MKRAALALAVCALTVPAAFGQSNTIAVPGASAGRIVVLPVQIVPASNENIARAAGNESEPDGVMVVPLPGSGYVLRTEHFANACDVTSMVPENPGMQSISSESICTSRWNAGNTAHSFVSTFAKGENASEWSRRHQEGFLTICSIYAPSGTTPAAANPDPTSNHDMAKTPWTDAQGLQHEVSTRRRDGETQDAWLARHREAVEAFAAVLQPQG